MAGRFEGLSDLEWKLFEDLLPQPPEKRGRGMPHVPFRVVLQKLCEDRKTLFQKFRLCNHSKDAVEEENTLFDGSLGNS